MLSQFLPLQPKMYDMQLPSELPSSLVSTGSFQFNNFKSFNDSKSKWIDPARKLTHKLPSVVQVDSSEDLLDQSDDEKAEVVEHVITNVDQMTQVSKSMIGSTERDQHRRLSDHNGEKQTIEEAGKHSLGNVSRDSKLDQINLNHPVVKKYRKKVPSVYKTNEEL